MKKMGFLSCYRSSKSIKKDAGNKNWRPFASLLKKIGSSTRQRNIAAEIRKYGTPKVLARSFSYKELVIATDNFNLAFMIGEGGFGRVFKGYIESIDQVVAVKQLDRNGLQGSREFFAEVLMLSMVQHPNLVKLIGYCAEGHERVLVYEYMPNGSLENHLLDLPSGKTPLDWNTRLKIAEGTAKGVEYLHDFADPPVIYRDFKASNILLDADFNPKLSDFGLATLGPIGGMDHVSTRVMGTYGYCAPEYLMSGKLTKKSDVYSYGVVFLEIITGRRAIDYERASGEQNMIAWAEPLFRDKHKFTMMADPLLQGDYPRKGLYQALAVAATCLQEEPESRPSIGDVVTALELIVRKNDHETTPSESTNKITYVNSMKRATSTRRKLEVSYSSVA